MFYTLLSVLPHLRLMGLRPIPVKHTVCCSLVVAVVKKIFCISNAQDLPSPNKIIPKCCPMDPAIH